MPAKISFPDFVEKFSMHTTIHLQDWQKDLLAKYEKAKLSKKKPGGVITQKPPRLKGWTGFIIIDDPTN